MAIRYIEFSELKAHGEGEFKPSGTLGSHHCIVSKQGRNLLVKGSASGEVVLEPGDTLRYNCGVVSRIKAPKTALDRLRKEYRIKIEFVDSIDSLSRDCSYRERIALNGKPGSYPAGASYNTVRWYELNNDGSLNRVPEESIIEEYEDGDFIGHNVIINPKAENFVVLLEVEEDTRMRNSTKRRRFIINNKRREAFKTLNEWAEKAEKRESFKLSSF